MIYMNNFGALTLAAVCTSLVSYRDRHSHFIWHLGPDAQNTVVLQEEGYCFSFDASELRLRGDSPVSQPHKDDEGNILCWNGEVRREPHVAQKVRT